MLCAPTREAVSEWLYRHHDVPTHSDENQALLRRAIAANRDEDIEVLRNSVQFGLASLQQYVEDPEEVYFVKSPKSFLGASGLKPQQVALFEDLVCAMMLHIKLQAESQLPELIDQAVIGRPINFQDNIIGAVDIVQRLFHMYVEHPAAHRTAVGKGDDFSIRPDEAAGQLKLEKCFKPISTARCSVWIPVSWLLP